ncbi:MAG: NAD(P)/FAD-dependent oxidoreductase [Caulobacteraceae bacterium]
MPETLDALVIGAGPAGLTAAIYLGRFRRRFAVIHSDESRLDWIPRTHNHPGFPGGVAGPELRARMRVQAEHYGAELTVGRVEALERTEAGFLARLEGGGEIAARYVILATGVIDHEPEMPAFHRAVRKGLIRICPICDAYEVTGKAVGVLGAGDKAARECMFMRHYSDRITLVHLGKPEELTPSVRAELESCGVGVVETAVGEVVIEGGRITALDFGSGDVRKFDTLYSALGLTNRNELALQLGAEVDETGSLRVNAHQETSVGRLYAAGDVVRGLNQISIAQGEAAIAATDIHNRLRGAK